MTSVVEHKGLAAIADGFAGINASFPATSVSGKALGPADTWQPPCLVGLFVRKRTASSLLIEADMLTQRRARVTIRLSDNEHTLVKQVAKDRAYLSPTAFIRAAIRNEINGRDGALSEAELRIAAGLDRASREIVRVQRAQMSNSSHTEAQIIEALKQVEAGRSAADLGREYGVSKHTIYEWKAKYGGLEVSEAQELKQLREENARLKKLVADLSLDKDMLQSVIRKNCLSSQ